MNTKHTPGPWHVGMRPGPMIYGADSAQVADMRGDLLARDEAAANVRLVVEAPAMLAALRRLAFNASWAAGIIQAPTPSQFRDDIATAYEIIARIDGAAR